MTRTTETSCPKCKTRLDAATSIDTRAQPKPGDVTICIECGLLMTFTPELDLRAMTNEEEEALPERNRLLLRRARATIAEAALRKARGLPR